MDGDQDWHSSRIVFIDSKTCLTCFDASSYRLVHVCRCRLEMLKHSKAQQIVDLVRNASIGGTLNPLRRTRIAMSQHLGHGITDTLHAIPSVKVPTQVSVE